MYTVHETQMQRPSIRADDCLPGLVRSQDLRETRTSCSIRDHLKWTETAEMI